MNVNTEFLTQVLTVGGPVTLLALISAYINYRLVMTWMEKVMEKDEKVSVALGEVLEGLRRLNGRSGRTSRAGGRASGDGIGVKT